MSIKLNDILCRLIINNKTIKDNFIKKRSIYITTYHLFQINNTVHYYSLINNDFTYYNIYVSSTNQPDHSEVIFKNLINNFDITKLQKIQIKFNKKINKYIVLDGIHRLCIMLYKNIISDSIPHDFLEIIKPNKQKYIPRMNSTKKNQFHVHINIKKIIIINLINNII
jgi:hypothetical protein